jgi:hypothetical protein
VTVAVSLVELTYADELTVIPVPENVATAPVSNPEPVITTARFWFCANEGGATEATVGAAVTEKTPVPVPVPPSPLVIVMFPAPVAATLEIEIIAVASVALTNAVEVTVIPLLENVAAKGSTPVFTKPVPVIVTV